MFEKMEEAFDEVPECTVPSTALRLAEEGTRQEENRYQSEVLDDSDVQMNEFEFTADLAVELPEEVEPEKFFGYLMRIMIAHTEAYGGFMGGASKWNRLVLTKEGYEANEDE